MGDPVCAVHTRHATEKSVTRRPRLHCPGVGSILATATSVEAHGD